MATSLAPDAAAPPGMCPGIAVLGGGGGAGDGDGSGKMAFRDVGLGFGWTHPLGLTLEVPDRRGSL